MKDAWRAQSVFDKFRIWFMPTGWRPEDVKAKYPIGSADPYAFQKYDTNASLAIKSWSWFQFLLLVFMLFHLLIMIVDIGSPQIYTYGLFMFFFVYCYTTLMDLDASAMWLEIIKSIIGLGIIYRTGSWFSIDSIVPFGTIFFAAYFVISAAVVSYFVFFDLDQKNENITGELSTN
jgi:ABC-type multidrug transport system fused ATPase/permease subunit